jgi:hypothetical protein
MARPGWTKVFAGASIQRSSQTLVVVADNAYIYGGEVRPREPVDSAMHRVHINLSKSAATSCGISF